MPADIELFDMLRPNVLESMTNEQLQGELDRILDMCQRVREYADAVAGIVRKRGEDSMAKNNKDVNTGRQPKDDQMRAVKKMQGTPVRQADLGPAISKSELPGEKD